MNNAAIARQTLWQCRQFRPLQLQRHSQPTLPSAWTLSPGPAIPSPRRAFGTTRPTASTKITTETTSTEATGAACPTTIARPRLSPLPFIYLRNLPYERSSALQQLLVDRQLRLRKEREVLRAQAAVAAAKEVGQNDDRSSPDSTGDIANTHKEDGSEDLVLLVEHTPTYTNGRRNRGAQGISDQEVLRLQNSGAVYVESLRGGEITYHGPGQLVAYPIMDLKPIKLSVRCYVSYLEKSIIATCAELGVKTITTENTGVWINGQKKIAAIGVHVQRYITSHGLALNCNTDLEFFNQIVACGLTGKETTSLSKELKDPSVDVQAVIPNFLKGFGATFNREFVALSETRPELEKAIQEYIQTGDPGTLS